MGNKKNIDRLFQEKFKEFEVFPERDIWAGIEAELDNTSSGTAGITGGRKKSTPVFWWRLGGIAAAIALLLSIGLNFLSTDPANTPAEDIIDKTVEVDKPAGEETRQKEEQSAEESNSWATTDNSGETEKEEKDKTTNPHQSVQTQGSASQQESGSRSSGADNTPQQPSNTEIAVADQSSSGENKEKDNTENKITESRIAATTDKNQNKTEDIRITGEESITETAKEQETRDSPVREKSKKGEKPKRSLIEAIAEMENEADREKELALKQGKGSKKWSVNPNVAPVYYNSLGGGSPIDPEFKDNSKSGKVNLSYGVNVAYQVSDRVSLRSGINKVNYGYNTNDISFAPDFEARALNNINYTRQSEKASGLYVSDANNGPPILPREEVASSFSPQQGRMQQEFGYIEVPMEIKYRVVDKKLGINLIGGVSSLFLTDNSVLLKSEALATELGEANNINDMNFSTNVGLGVDYLLSDKLQLQIEPMFKYQWNTFSNDDGGFKPYSFGVYTGFSFRF